MRRSPNAVFVGGHYVFPGGAVDPADGEIVVNTTRFVRHGGVPSAAVFAGVDPSVPAGSPDAADDPTGHDAYVVAAIREAFEEAGLLLARHRAGAWVDFDDQPTRERFSAYRMDVTAVRLRFWISWNGRTLLSTLATSRIGADGSHQSARPGASMPASSSPKSRRRTMQHPTTGTSSMRSGSDRSMRSIDLKQARSRSSSRRSRRCSPCSNLHTGCMGERPATRG